MDVSVLVFRNGVSEWMVQSRNGWSSLGVSGGVSKQCFEMDGGVSKQCFGVSKWMVVFPDFILSSTTARPGYSGVARRSTGRYQSV